MASKNIIQFIFFFFVGVLVGAGILLLFVQSALAPFSQLSFPTFSPRTYSVPDQGSAVIASLMIDFGNGRVLTCNKQRLVKEQAVLNLLEFCSKNPQNPFELKTKNDPNLGVFVTQIGDKISGQGNAYWQYWVNNEYAQVGAGQYQLKSGDIVEWKFTKGQF